MFTYCKNQSRVYIVAFFSYPFFYFRKKKERKPVTHLYYLSHPLFCCYKKKKEAFAISISYIYFFQILSFISVKKPGYAFMLSFISTFCIKKKKKDKKMHLQYLSISQFIVVAGRVNRVFT